MFGAGDAVDLGERPHDGVGVATHHGQVGEVGLVVEVVEGCVEVAHRRPQTHEHRDAGRDEDGGEDEAEPVTGWVSHEGGRLSHPSGRVRGMCRMCEGFSQEDMLAEESAIIEEHGYLVTGVGRQASRPTGPTRSVCSTEPTIPS